MKDFMQGTAEKNRKRGLAFKLSLFILASTTMIFLIAFGYNYSESRYLVMKNVEENAKNLALSTSHQIENVLRGVDDAPRYLASSLEYINCSDRELLMQIEGIVRLNSDIFGSTVAFEPYTRDPRRQYFAPYYCRDKDHLKLSYLGGKGYHYPLWDWYLIPKELGAPAWSEPYFDEGGGNIVMSTYSVPFYRNERGKRTFAGVVTADMSLDWLKETMAKARIYRTGFAFLISRNGVFVSHPDKGMIMRESIFSLAENAGDTELREIGRKMISGAEGFVSLPEYFTGKKAWMYYAPLPSAGWSIGVVIPGDELFADVRNLSWIVLVIGIGGFAFLFFVITSISHRITHPLRQLAQTTSEIAKGNLDVDLPRERSGDEVGELTASFENMQAALKEYIANLKETTAAKERMESELKIARTIQMSFLPKQFPPFPEKKEFDIFATLVPAREVGGDLYDFFLLDEEKLFFAIGDVSGKGVPAALFMAAAKILMKGSISRDVDIAETLGRVNRELCIENEATMFLTYFCGILNFRTGELKYSNAGHNPPLLLRPGRKPERLSLPEGIFLGVFEESPYLTYTTRLEPGDTLLLYTDGVTEAMNSGEKVYTEARLYEFSGALANSHPEHMVREIVADVQHFAGDAPQSDDITVLALLYRGKQ
ncbi:MAG TPA: SpoIIE family protein phosphatase [Syntrophales bacterium]|nr:SpoIIE family protein phosphatase [Syntrophales bacterium]